MTVPTSRAGIVTGFRSNTRSTRSSAQRNSEMSIPSIRRACREYADRWFKVQRDEFVRLGVLGQWNDPYLTMDHEYEAEIASALHGFMLAGYVTRGLKPVHWCSECRTALAEAEVEYRDHTSPSVTVAFALDEDARKKLEIRCR